MKKLITLLLAAATVISSMAFVSCKDEQEEETKMITILADGSSNYAIYRSDKATDGEKAGGTALRTLINDKTGVRMDYTTDDKFGKIEGKLEILVGNTNRDASAVAAEGLGENQFRFLMVGDTLAIAASNPNCYEAAAQTFADEYVTESGISVPENLDRTWQCTLGYTTYEVKNPINDEGDDPYVTQHNGTYYYCWSGGGGVRVSSAPSIDKISKDGGVQVYSAPPNTMWSSEYWAPEMHYINGEWYIYVAADDGEDINHRMYVLKGKSQDPLKGFTMVGKITDPSDKWAIDGTVLQVNGELYFVWSGWQGDNDFGNQKLYIAHMSDPCTIDSERVVISVPQHGWEGPLNEGPIPVYHNGEIYIIYSGNGSWTADYCLGYLKLVGSDPMKTKNWEKSTSPILSRNSVAVGPGHCSVATAVDGSQWVIYHANLPDAEVGWKGRSVWMQKLEFTSGGKIKLMRNEKTVDYPEECWTVEYEITK